jgi:cytochrome P450
VIAGYETTSTALSYISYVLATHPNEQQKLQEHIDALFDPETETDMPSYDTVSQMSYLDMFIRETLRMYPIAPLVINRQSTEEFHIKGIGKIPVGTRIAVDMYSLHFILKDLAQNFIQWHGYHLELDHEIVLECVLL